MVYIFQYQSDFDLEILPPSSYALQKKDTIANS